MVRLIALTLIFWMVPNSNGPLWDDIRYLTCMATAGDDDWTCELVFER